jgi:hypothetical protein
MKGDSNGKDEKMRAENGRIRGDSVLAGAVGRSKTLRARSIGAFGKRGGPIDGHFRNDCM